MRLLLTLLAIFGLCLTSLGCAGRDGDEDLPNDLITAVIAGGLTLGNGDAITVAPSSNLTLELILVATTRPPSAFRWTATNGGVLGSPSTKNNTLDVGDTPQTIAVRVEVDIPHISGPGVDTGVFNFQVIVATNLTRLIKSISVDGIPHQNNAAFDINGARTVQLKVELFSGITPSLVTGVATRGFIAPFVSITTPPISSTWQMPNTPGIDVLTFTVEGSNGSLTGTETWHLTANVK